MDGLMNYLLLSSVLEENAEFLTKQPLRFKALHFSKKNKFELAGSHTQNYRSFPAQMK